MKRSCSGVLCTYYYYINVYKFLSLRRGRKVSLEATCSINEYLHDPVGFNSWRDHVTLRAKSVNRELSFGNGVKRPEKDSLLTAGELRTCVQITNAICDVIMEKVTFRAVSFRVRQIKTFSTYAPKLPNTPSIIILNRYTTSIDKLTKIVLMTKFWSRPTYCVFFILYHNKKSFYKHNFK